MQFCRWRRDPTVAQDPPAPIEDTLESLDHIFHQCFRLTYSLELSSFFLSAGADPGTFSRKPVLFLYRK